MKIGFELNSFLYLDYIYFKNLLINTIDIKKKLEKISHNWYKYVYKKGEIE